MIAHERTSRAHDKAKKMQACKRACLQRAILYTCSFMKTPPAFRQCWAVFTYTRSGRNLIVVEADKEMQDDVALRNRRREVVRREVTILNQAGRMDVRKGGCMSRKEDG